MIGSYKLWIVVIAFLAIAGGFGYKQYQTTQLQNQVELLEANSAILNQALRDSNEAFNNLQSEYDKIRVIYEKTVSEFKKVDADNSYAKERIETIDTKSNELVNKSFNDTIRCLELATGAPLNEIEKGAKNAKEFNEHCPWFYPGSDVGGVSVPK